MIFILLPFRGCILFSEGRKKGHAKFVWLTEVLKTISVDNLINKSFSQVLDERLKESGADISGSVKDILVLHFSEQENFSKVRNVEKGICQIEV